MSALEAPPALMTNPACFSDTWAPILKFAEFCAAGSSRYQRAALVYDVRTALQPTLLDQPARKMSLRPFEGAAGAGILDKLKENGYLFEILFMEASDQVPQFFQKSPKKTISGSNVT